MGPLLETKLHIPNRSGTRIARPRLSERLATSGDGTLVVVSAPAGFGKTTLLTEWLGSLPSDGSRAAWLSLDEHDNDPIGFWVYVVAALRTALGAEFGGGTWALLQDARAPLDAVVAMLINELVGGPTEVILVLDDYHVLDTPEIHESVARLLERLPPQLTVVVATRSDPPLPLGRRRASGGLVEIRARDLRFTPGETAAYLDQASVAALSDQDVAALAERTEGWAAALQLAALSMAGRDDLSTFVAEFAGDDRYIVDYLAEEVLDRQPEKVRSFLLHTSLLDRLSGGLCDAVTGHTTGRAMLESLERANMFLVPLDDRRQWYRYHHLFADVLQAHLRDEQPDVAVELHSRASRWYASNGETDEAIRHALAAGDLSSTADLIEMALPAWRRHRQEATMRRWLQRLPDEVVRVRPVLSVGLVGAMAAVGQFGEDGQERLDEAERLLRSIDNDDGTAGQEIIVADREQLRSLPAAIEMYRAALALTQRDLDDTQIHGRRALDLAPDDDHLVRGAAAALVGLASWAGGDLEAAAEAYAESIDRLRRAGHIADVMGCSITLADIRLAQGRLRDLHPIYTDALDLAMNEDGAPLRGTADMHVGLSQVHREWGELDAAMDHLQRSAALGEHNGLPQHPYRSRLAMARLLDAQGEFEAALGLLDEAERLYMTDFSPSIRPIPAVRAGMLAVRGHVDEATVWVRERGLAADDELDYLTEFEHITLARVMVAQFRAQRSDESIGQAIGLLERLRTEADAGGRTRAALQIQVLGALAEDARGHRPAALTALETVVTQAEPERYVRLFLDEGPAIRPLLEALAARGTATGYVGRVLGASSTREPRSLASHALVDPLSDRELDVLRLLASELSGPEIARELTVSLNTMRTHTKNIYMKLGVTNRRAAVRHAADLHLLSGPGQR